jgi:hypothetical protein
MLWPEVKDVLANAFSDADAALCRSRFFGTCRGGSVSVDDDGRRDAPELLVARLWPVCGRVTLGYCSRDWIDSIERVECKGYVPDLGRVESGLYAT